jgi:hypothetical protein
MPAFCGTRPLKRWRYVGVFGERFMICAAAVQVGFARQSFWAVLDRADGGLVERTRLPVPFGVLPRRAALDLGAGRLRLRDDAARLDLLLDEGRPVEVVCPHGGSYVWTRKQAGVGARGTLVLGASPPREVEGRAVIDDTAGYHARATEWRWAAGVGESADGAQVAFNLVEGVNDPPTGSERAVWVAGTPHEAPPVRFAPDLRSIRCEDGTELRFAPEAERRRRDNLIFVRSEYRAPFGSFSGTLPGGTPLACALGVVEHHRARW